jgi:hypothetical protein
MVISTATWFKSRPMSIRIPMPAGIPNAIKQTANVTAIRSGPPELDPSSQPHRSIAASVTAMTDNPSATRHSVRRPRRMVSVATRSPVKSRDFEQAVVITAPIPRSAKGSSRLRFVISETSPNTASPVSWTMMAVFSSPTTAISGVPAIRRIVPSTIERRSRA